MEVVEDYAVMSDLQGKRKLRLGIQMLITARFIQGTIINYIYTLAPLEEAICLEVFPLPYTIVYGSYNR